MKTFKPIFSLILAVVVVTIMIPALLVLPFSSEKAVGKLAENTTTAKKKAEPAAGLPASSVEVSVYRSAKKQIQKLPLETYVAGVVSAEMPADFEIEALKAQALTARTYIVNQLTHKDGVALPEGADVTDTEMHQVFNSEKELKKVWGSDYSWKIKKIHQAVAETAGQIITYDGTPITATFFSTSNGYTENSEAYWEHAYPYLTSVSSPWDKNSPKFYDKKVISIREFEAKLGVKLSNSETVGTITERTPGKRVGTVKINGKKWSGKEIREALGLKSADFDWERKGDQIVISTKGFGHGVGMSQYGANGMAKEGRTYQEIVKHYYKGVEVASSNSLLSKLTAGK
ncbi:stage II sporulation protein D [Bacillus sp. M6-12]|uniref:stage II sporulation protein D n=1 Tax=Bacillus sp. M6-12 TaxID=2054166 RepID=UPI000C779605|nr:stage II sporulation protein D [Bacillus sp. M6-12]PLS17750.1 stage II sporulation protein D [Bacillus sp. M6-12]